MQFHSSNEEEEETLGQNSFFVRLCTRCFSGKDKQANPQAVDVQDRKTSRYKTNSFTQFRWLVWRDFVNVFKNPFEIRLRIFLALVCSTDRMSLLTDRISFPSLVPRYSSRSAVHSSDVRSNCNTKRQCLDLSNHYQHLVYEYLRRDTGRHSSNGDNDG